MKRIIYYYQTFCGLQNILKYENPVVTHIIVSSIHFGINADVTPYIHLNNYSPFDNKFNKLWEELRQAHTKGIKIMLMMGGAGGAYKTLLSNFDIYYTMLKNIINKYDFICGIDLDIEENVKLDNVKIFKNKLDKDFGKDFIITMAPVSSSLSNDHSGMGGFIYKKLFQSNEGMRINWFNGQFYGSYTFDIFNNIINNGYPANKVVMGMLSGNYDKKNFKNALMEIKKISDKYNNFGGVFDWEYCDSPPNTNNHYEWANLMYLTMNSKSYSSCKIL